uniref:POSSIBLE TRANSMEMBRANE PROTEIN n=1 Tax=Nonomuraea gerenzanensis TaxID=93944 RepID=A0A1M4EMG1_9ACTN|nr:POSSIBLE TRANSMEMBRANE PROTEIN [Nonomuraea gerenzanensis]
MRVEARLDEPLNRGLWIVKWFLAIPHYLVLSLLWIAFGVLTVVAFFAILFTGRYPRALFDFNLGVLRWTWRVAYYTYGALGTDRYPPFTLGAAPDYPATLEIDYPERLSRGLVLVKWWLLAIPHYLVVGLFTSGSVISWNDGLPDGGGVLYTLDWGGLIGLLVLIAALCLLFTGRYPHGVHDLVLGLNRWAIRVAAYATLMTDAYPPFRLEQGGHELPRLEPPPASAHTPARHGAASVVALTAGSVLAFAGLVTAATGTSAALLGRARDTGGFISTGAQRVAAALPWLEGLTTGLFIATAVLLVAGAALILTGIRLATVPASAPVPVTPAR